ncbi:MAG: D-glycero-beta-D-manno-heptose 1,7-bisphosphate 7-phosphatase [Candidatus Omnitrophica bacterium]|nr:D-glycero-beta-D-manno-heptose 1,7-bisphosphate 7-phosphatase [Candidatus Omnitrophota bacterium]
MKAIFLDRDGVINRYPGDTKYVTSVKDFRFLPGAKQAIARLHQAGFRIFVISNQAGVGKGIYSRKELDNITRKMLLGIRSAGGNIDKVYYCTHRKEENCSCRKPQTGMLKSARREYQLDLKKAIFIGDTIRDVHTARNAGCESYLVLCGKEKTANRKNWQIQPDKVFANLRKAAGFILSSL